MQKNRQIYIIGTIIANCLISILFFYYQCEQQPQVTIFVILKSALIFICPILQIMVTVIPSFCYKGHCKPPFYYKRKIIKPTNNSENQKNQQLVRKKSLQFEFSCQSCQECKIPKYVRMKHCFRCKKCVHKYDHHCVLLNVCIGEANQKYYFLYLWFMLYNNILIITRLLKWIDKQSYLDQNGIQHISVTYFFEAVAIIFLSLILLLVCYLTFIHTCFILKGETTYQNERKQVISYFKHFKKHIYRYINANQAQNIDLQKVSPFNYGMTQNIIKVFKASSYKPIDWRLSRDGQTFLMADSQNSKSGQEWGRQSSNQLIGHQTTKSRQSANYLQILDKMANKS